MPTDNESTNKLNKPSIPVSELAQSLQIPEVEATYERVFKQITKLEDGDVIIKAQCKFCHHPVREEAERKYEQGNRTSYTLVHKFFKDWEDKNPDSKIPPMNLMNVRSHLLNHYLQQERRIMMREYGDNLREMMNYKIDKDQRFDMLRASLELKVHEIASDRSLESNKQADTICKLAKAICDIEITRGKLKSQLDTEQAVIEKCANAWDYAIRLTDDPDTKRILVDAMESFEASLEGVILPENIK